MAMKINMIVAYDLDGNIGKDGGMPWRHFKEDMAHFTSNTKAGNNPGVIMGRKTWESLPERHRPLADRFNIVVSSTMDDSTEDYCSVVKSIPEGVLLGNLMNLDTLWVIGGASIYEAVFQLGIFVSEIYVTEIQERWTGCDTQFPKLILYGRYHVVHEQEVFTEEKNRYNYTFKTFQLNDY